MSEADGTPQKAVAGPETYCEALDDWMRERIPEAKGLCVHDVDMPRATGFSNETIFFSASFSKRGENRTRKFVTRIEPVEGLAISMRHGPRASRRMQRGSRSGRPEQGTWSRTRSTTGRSSAR